MTTPLSRNELATSCQDCLFQHKLGTQQIGCTIQPIDNYTYDIIDGSFKFHTKICQYKRNQEWADNQELSDIHDLWKVARLEASITYSVVIREDSLDNIKKTADSIIKWNLIQPRKLIVISNLGLELDEYLKTLPVPWTVTVYLADQDYRSYILINNDISHFFVFANNGIEFTKWFFDFLDYKVNDDGLRFRCIGDNNPIIISRRAYLLNEMPIQVLISKIVEHKEGYINYDDFSGKLLKEFGGSHERFLQARLSNPTLEKALPRSKT